MDIHKCQNNLDLFLEEQDKKSSFETQPTYLAPSWIDDCLDEMLEKTSKLKVPQGKFCGEKHTYSPTMLETYGRCPWGWFINTIADVTYSPGSSSPFFRQRTHTGSVLHNLLDHREQDPEFSIPEKYQDILEPVIEKYLEQWPSNARYSEMQLKMTLDNGIRIQGRSDRIDIFSEGLVVIDWKLNCKLTPSSEEKNRQKQRFLYPLMAQETLGIPILGMMYVSLEKCRHEGSFVTLDNSVPQQEGDTHSDDWQTGADQTLQEVKQLVSGMESGDWFRKGDACPDWCGCHLEEEAYHKWH